LKTAASVTYTYDSDGRRVAKSNGKLYWYGSGGEVLAETDAAGNTQNEYIFFGGQRIAMVPAGGTPLYYVEDLLGTSRVITQSNGAVCYDADFYPFGGERTPYTNTCSQNYKFEGKERDAETGNDDFGARYYSNRFGRWLSADWSAIPVPVPYANLTNPQTLNLYAMVADDPESFADLDGHECCQWLKQKWNELKAWWDKESAPSPEYQKLSPEQKAQVDAAVFGTLYGAVMPFPEPEPEPVAEPVVEPAENQAPGLSGETPEPPAAEEPAPSRPTEPYNRRAHYGNTPTNADRKAIGGESVDHDPPLVQRYYEGDPSRGEPPGYAQTQAERRASAADRSRMKPSTRQAQRQQGGKMSQYSKRMNPKPQPKPPVKKQDSPSSSN